MRACGDVIEHELIGALVAIARGELQDVADDAMVAEAHAFYDLAVADVEAGDDASGKNGRSSSQCDAFFQQRLAADGGRDPGPCQGGEIGGVANTA